MREDLKPLEQAKAFASLMELNAWNGKQVAEALRVQPATVSRISRHDVVRMIKRRARVAGLPDNICCHTFRATGITAYLENGGTIENAQAIAAHESPRTTKLYDRTSDAITLDEIERITI